MPGWVQAIPVAWLNHVVHGTTMAKSTSVLAARCAWPRPCSPTTPVFDWFAYGGALTVGKRELSIILRDGLRQRFAAIFTEAGNSPEFRFKMELDRDGLAAEKSIVTDKSLNKVTFTLENRIGDVHTTELLLSFPPGSSYSVLQNGKSIPLKQTGNWDYPLRAELKVTAKPGKIETCSLGPLKRLRNVSKGYITKNGDASRCRKALWFVATIRFNDPQ